MLPKTVLASDRVRVAFVTITTVLATLSSWVITDGGSTPFICATSIFNAATSVSNFVSFKISTGALIYGARETNWFDIDQNPG